MWVLEVPLFGILGGHERLFALQIPPFVGVQINVAVGSAPSPQLLASGLVLGFGSANEPGIDEEERTGYITPHTYEQKEMHTKPNTI